jgi:hypothetical protein
MFVAVLTVCLLSAPTDCRTTEFYLTESMPFMLWREAETKALAWLDNHPDMQAKSLKVVVGRGV